MDFDVDGSMSQTSVPSPDEESFQPSWSLNASMECYDLLSSTELELCMKLRLLPKEFIAIKERIVTESLGRGLLEPEKQLIRVDINKTDHIFDIFLSTGWDTNKEAFESRFPNGV
jgi:hypothetical protein